MRRISFTVSGLPPNIKKNKGSMSRIQEQATRLERLQNEAFEALRSQASDEPFKDDVRLTLSVHVGFNDARDSGIWGLGDLDNFVAGVCDGLKKGDSEDYVIFDDSKVVKIDAEKLLGPDPGSWYAVTLEGQ